MRPLKLIPAIALFLAACSGGGQETGKEKGAADSSSTVKAAKDTTRKSIPSEAKASVGNAEVKISYHAPAVRGRTIWGGLVAYDAVWVTGAHKATRLDVSSDFRVGNTTVPAGSYALFTIPGKEEWTVIINRNWNQHLADDYSESEDVARIKVKPQATEELTERLKYTINPVGEGKGDIIISWEKLNIAFPIEVR